MGCGASSKTRYQVEQDEVNGHTQRVSSKGKFSEADQKLILEALQASAVCSFCSKDELDELSQDVELKHFKQGEAVCSQDQPGTHFFIVQSGTFEEVKQVYSSEGKAEKPRARTLQRGSSFGELALIQDCAQKIYVGCVKDGSIWGVDGKTFRKVLNQLSSRHADDNRQELAKVSLFKGLSEDQRDLLVNCMHVHSYKKGVYIVREGDIGEGVYIVKEGELKVSAKGKELRRLGNGKSFGESALLNKDEAQKFSVVTLSKATLISIGRQQLQEVLRIDTLERLIFTNFITTALSEAFKELTRRQVEALMQVTEQCAFGPGVAILPDSGAVTLFQMGSSQSTNTNWALQARNSGDWCGTPTMGHYKTNGSSDALPPLKLGITEPLGARSLDKVRFFIVLEGSVDVINPGESVAQPRRLSVGSKPADLPSLPNRHRRISITAGRLEHGDCFGKEYVMDPNQEFQHTVRSREASKIAFLSSDAIRSVLGTLDILEVAKDNEKMDALKSIYFFHVLSSGQLARVARAFRALPSMKNEDKVVTQGEVGETFYFIADGEVSVTIGTTPIRIMRKGEWFGERALIFNERRTANVTVSKDDTVLWAMDKHVFLPIVSESMRAHLEYRCALQDTSVVFEDLQMGRVLGKGNFGVVRLVVHAKTQTRYAMKFLLKSRVVKLEQCENVQREREILATADHPFIIKMVRTFKDERQVYFLTELLTGGELYQVIRILGLLDRAKAQFYFGCLVLSIEYLQSRSIIFRDLKPENVLITTRGYTKLIDFGCARKLVGQRSFSLVGTPNYMAPEIVLGKGYRCSADVWSLGVCLFEFLCGNLPFGEDVGEDRMDIFKSILTDELKFPESFKDSEGQDLMKQLLTRNPSARIGCSLRGFDDIKEHPYYTGFSWEKLLAMDLEPPYTPPENKEVFASDAEKGVTDTWNEDDDGDVELEKASLSSNWYEKF